MSPESHESNTRILEESARIRDVLLTSQEEVNAYHATLSRMKAGVVRRNLGYPEPDAVVLDDLVDSRIVQKTPVVSPEAVEMALPVTEVSAATTRQARSEIEQVLAGEDDRLLAIVGPCSIHDPEAALEYAAFIKEMREEYGSDLVVIMRDYAEKPRTETGWKGFLHDPLLDGSNDMNLGLIADRMLALRITGMGVPIARERLGANTPQYVNGLVAYDAIGARNVEDQNSRMYASGTSSPIGFKNATDGSINSALSACVAANAEHSFIGLNGNGQQAEVYTAGNPFAHIILRGGKQGPNFDQASVEDAVKAIAYKNTATGLAIPEGVVVDASHQNKVNGSQMEAVKVMAAQIKAGGTAIRGVMVESNIKAGAQKLVLGHATELEYGVSITDSCVSIDETKVILSMLATAVQARRLKVVDE